MRWTALVAGIAFILVAAPGTMAQRKTVPEQAEPAEPPGAAQPKAQAPVQPPQQQLAMPDAEKIVLLLRNSLITLNDAIQTGNFTVLRDRSAPGFRDANSAAQLGQIFAKFAARGIDLSVVSVLTPQLTEPPVLDREAGMLRVKGYFPTQPVQVNFEVLYQVVGGRWRLFGIAVTPSEPAPVQESGAKPR